MTPTAEVEPGGVSDAPSNDPPSDWWVMRGGDLPRLISILVSEFDEVIGPVAVDGVIRLRPIQSAADLPRGVTDEQETGSYRLSDTGTSLHFSYGPGPDSLKSIVHPPRSPVWTMRRRDGSLIVEPALHGTTARAVIGTRACDIRALGVLERTQTGGPHADPGFTACRAGLFLVTVDCTHPAPTCFCDTLQSRVEGGVAADHGYDLALTELDDRNSIVYLVRAGTDRGRSVIGALALVAAPKALLEQRDRELASASRSFVRELPDDAPALVRQADHPHWDEVAERCLTCGNCTAVCPTCFCTDMEDLVALDGESSTRTRDLGHLLQPGVLTSRRRAAPHLAGLALPTVAVAQAGHLARPVRRVGMCRLRSLHHLVPGRYRSHRRSRIAGCPTTRHPTARNATGGHAVSILDSAPSPGLDPLLVPRVHEVLAIIPEIPDVVTIRCAPIEGEPFEFSPAQIGMVGAFGIGEAAISISSPASERRFHEYTIRRAGQITGALTRMRPGDQFWVRGPFGTSWDLDLDGRDVLIAAGGIGLAPLRSAVYSVIKQRERYGKATLVVGARSSAQLLYANEYEMWREHGLAVFDTIDEPEPGWSGRVGFVSDVVEQLGIAGPSTSALLCGPDIMMQLTAERLLGTGVPPDEIQLTLERNMQCGNGLCGHCQLGPVIVCRDGPAMRYPAVAASLMVKEL